MNGQSQSPMGEDQCSSPEARTQNASQRKVCLGKRLQVAECQRQHLLALGTTFLAPTGLYDNICGSHVAVFDKFVQVHTSQPWLTIIICLTALPNCEFFAICGGFP